MQQTSPISRFRQDIIGRHRPQSTRVVALQMLKNDIPWQTVVETLCVGTSTLFRWRREYKKSGKLAPIKSRGRPRKFTAEHETSVLERLEEQPSLSLGQLVATENLPINAGSLSRHLMRMGLRRKKIDDHPVNWPSETVVEEIRAYLNVIENIPDDKLVYYDESFAYTNEAPTHGRALRGKRINRGRENHGKRYMFAMAIKTSGPIHAPGYCEQNNERPCFHVLCTCSVGSCTSARRRGRLGPTRKSWEVQKPDQAT